MNQLYTVTTPNADFNGIRVGVKFKGGRAQCDRRKAIILTKNFKYRSPELEAEEKAAQEAAQKQAQEAAAKTNPAPATDAVAEEKARPETTSVKPQPKWTQHRK